MSIQNLGPQVVWKNFYALTQIPRPSKHEGKVIDYLYNWGLSHGFDTVLDGGGNVIIRVPATPGLPAQLPHRPHQCLCRRRMGNGRPHYFGCR